ncbi:MAG: hypothetical protein Q8882_01205 [Bacillota bacterium]|nr:hypothetical protein [Bacillota bacterium]
MRKIVEPDDLQIDKDGNLTRAGHIVAGSLMPKRQSPMAELKIFLSDGVTYITNLHNSFSVLW